MGDEENCAGVSSLGSPQGLFGGGVRMDGLYKENSYI
jgi:hypothetical protein